LAHARHRKSPKTGRQLLIISASSMLDGRPIVYNNFHINFAEIAVNATPESLRGNP
jgi:hypothetical protein